MQGQPAAPHVPGGPAAHSTGMSLQESVVLPLVSPRTCYGLNRLLGGTDFTKIGERKIRDVVGDAIQLVRRHFHFGPKPGKARASQRIKNNLPPNTLRPQA